MRNRVTSRDISPRKKKPTAIVRGRTVEAIANQTIRASAIIALISSFVGTIIAINGRWPTTLQFWKEISIIAAIGGIFIQGFCTLMEWAFRNQRLTLRYLVPFFFDVAGTYAGYAILLAPIFMSALARTGLPQPAPMIIAHIGVLLIAAFVAYYPEQNLIDEE